MSDENVRRAWFEERAAHEPMHAAQKGMKPAIPKRFWKEAGLVERDGLFVVALDGRVARTPGKGLLGVASRPLAVELAAEWGRQGEHLDPATMPLTRIVNSALDGVAHTMDAVSEEIFRFAGTDLICYRAAEPEKLVVRQQLEWDPVLAWAREALDASFTVAIGVIHVPQPQGALEAVARAVAMDDPLRLAALHVLTTLTGSALLALAVMHGRLDAEAAFAAAHVDEDFQIELWGTDEEAEARRAHRWREMAAAAQVLALT